MPKAPRETQKEQILTSIGIVCKDYGLSDHLLRDLEEDGAISAVRSRCTRSRLYTQETLEIIALAARYKTFHLQGREISALLKTPRGREGLLTVAACQEQLRALGFARKTSKRTAA